MFENRTNTLSLLLYLNRYDVWMTAVSERLLQINIKFSKIVILATVMKRNV